MNIKTGLTALLMAIPLLANAGAREELVALEATKTASADAAAVTASTIPVPAPVNLMSLPDGRQANMKDDAVVLFMQAHCQYSAKTRWNGEIWPLPKSLTGCQAYTSARLPRRWSVRGSTRIGAT